MADLLCSGTWTSQITSQAEDDDGQFELVLNAKGEISGLHRFTDATRNSRVAGTCKHSFFGGHRIELWEIHEGYAFRYRAKIKRDPDNNRHKTQDGKRHILGSPLKAGRKTDDDGDDDWVGTHST